PPRSATCPSTARRVDGRPHRSPPPPRREPTRVCVRWRRSGSPAVTLRALEHLLLHPSPLRGEQRKPGGGESRERCTEPCDRPAPPWDRQHGSWLVQYLANRPHHVLGLEQHTGE